MNDNSEARNTKWGLIAGLGCVALFVMYQFGIGAIQRGSNARACGTCRQSVGVSQAFGNAHSQSDADTK